MGVVCVFVAGVCMHCWAKMFCNTAECMSAGGAGQELFASCIMQMCMAQAQDSAVLRTRV